MRGAQRNLPGMDRGADLLGQVQFTCRECGATFRLRRKPDGKFDLKFWEPHLCHDCRERRDGR